jgi:hypothetical protein
VKPSDGSARFAIIAVTVVIAVGSLIQIFGWGVLALAVIAFVGMNQPDSAALGLLALGVACVPTFVSINDVCGVDIEYRNVDGGAIIGRARSGEVSGA